MRVEIVDDTKDPAAAAVFPPGENFVDLRQNLHGIDRIPAARAYLPLRNFLVAVNSQESVFATLTAAVECKPIMAEAAGEVYEFSSRTSLVFTIPSLNFDRSQYVELAERLKELLERDSADSIRGVLRVAACVFQEHAHRGFCLGIRLVAHGDSAKQAELRWGFGLARVQQALLFRARALGQQIGA